MVQTEADESGHTQSGSLKGGRSDFSWESVKTDRHKDHYLGHSIMAPTGRWASKNDALWYEREKKRGSNSQHSNGDEKRKVKELEDRAMAEALGIPYVAKPNIPETGFSELKARSGNTSSTPPISAHSDNFYARSSRSRSTRSRSPVKSQRRRSRDDSRHQDRHGTHQSYHHRKDHTERSGPDKRRHNHQEQDEISISQADKFLDSLTESDAHIHPSRRNLVRR
ncbi:kinase phosphorylation protein-domain-containing protein [Lipomyces oligophaga]|uniref:kinase phosphorylation protein-domain-containing protein n=1 Tax=Lipomyces oligophaga TaxID=45792 RepID=UPI0034CE1EF6